MQQCGGRWVGRGVILLVWMQFYARGFSPSIRYNLSRQPAASQLIFSPFVAIERSRASISHEGPMLNVTYCCISCYVMCRVS